MIASRSPRRGVWLTKLQLQGLENRLVVLILMLQDHMVDIRTCEQRIRFVEIDSLQPLQNTLADFLEPAEHFGERRDGKAGPRCARMLKRVVHPRHLGEL